VVVNRDTARRVLGVLLLVHATGHVLPAMRVLDIVSGTIGVAPVPFLSIILVTTIVAVTLSALLGSGLGFLGVRPFAVVPRHLAGVGLTASVLLLVGLRPVTAWIGVGLNAAFALVIFRFCRDEVTRPAAAGRLRWRDAAAVGFVVYIALVALVRPWHQRWGSTEKELRAPLPGDQYRAGEATYGIQRAVTIHAPPEDIWPWLAQMGQDRGGFYSYAFLENLTGLGVRNANRVHLEWQDIEARRFVQATPAGWLGRTEPLGWRVPLAEPNQVLVLEKWGAFVLLPSGERVTRFIIRTRGDAPMDATRFALAPFSLLLLEPLHFIMERRMMLGVKERAEQASTVRAAGAGPR
jgi:hypothetical protein